jgi:hypothetical protein
MKRTPEEKLRDPKPESKIKAAQKAGVDLNKLIENLKLTPTQRLEQLQEEMIRHEEELQKNKNNEN